MITYTTIKHFIDEMCDYEDLLILFLVIPLAILGDIVLIIFQPVFYLIYKKCKEEIEE